MIDGAPNNPNFGKELGSSFLGGDGKLYNDSEIFKDSSSVDLPDSKIADQEMKDNFIRKHVLKDNNGAPEINPFSVTGSTKIKSTGLKMNPLKLVFSLLALVLAFVFYFILPNSGIIDLVLPLASSIAASAGVTNWRQQYDMAKAWFQSKTIVGSLMVVIPVCALIIINFFALGVPGWLITAIISLIGLGGGTTIWGIFDVKKNLPTQLKI